ncbi:MAG: histidine kinase [Agriterribacter sp.]
MTKDLSKEVSKSICNKDVLFKRYIFPSDIIVMRQSMPSDNAIVRDLNNGSIVTLVIALLLLTISAVAQSGVKGGMETASGFLPIYTDGLANKTNLTVQAKDVIAVLPLKNNFRDINVFLFNANVKDTIGFHYEQFPTGKNENNSFKKINDSLYEIYINDPGKQVLFAYKENEALGVGVKGTMSGGLSSPNLMGEAIDTLTIVDGNQKNHYKVLPFNPFLYGLGLYIWNKKNNSGRELVTFSIFFRFPEPQLIGLRTDTAIINKKSVNPSLRYYDNVEFNKKQTHPSLWDRKAIKLDVKNLNHTFSKKENSVLFVFEHLGYLYRYDYFDNLQYKVDNQRDWVLTPLAYNPSILLEHVAPGKHKLQVRYPIEAAPVFAYDFEVLPDWKDSRLWPILASVLLTTIVLFLFFRTRLKRAEERAKKNRLELQSIQSQLNPHFMFNALGSIQHLVHNDKQSADLYLTEFSNLLRHSLYNSEKEMVPLSVELQTLNSYISLEKLRFQFSYEQKLDEHLETDNISIPALLIQPLIENAIKHGIASLQQKGGLQMNIYPQEKDLVIEITDNGKGFSEEKPGTGLGLKLVKERIEVLKRQGMHILLLFKDNRSNETTATVVFKDWL